jgi:deazaflavin-dependent oxidoreductase (nitroreductase family)
MMGHQVLLLHTIGRKSGLARTNALFYFMDDERYVVIGSHLGEPKHPGWYHNLMASPRTMVQVGTRRLEVQGREAEGEERARIWDMVVAKDAQYTDYQALTDRVIPVIILEPI